MVILTDLLPCQWRLSLWPNLNLLLLRSYGRSMRMCWLVHGIQLGTHEVLCTFGNLLLHCPDFCWYVHSLSNVFNFPCTKLWDWQNLPWLTTEVRPWNVDGNGCWGMGTLSATGSQIKRRREKPVQMELSLPSWVNNLACELVEAMLGMAVDLINLSGNAGTVVGKVINRMPAQTPRRMRRTRSQQREMTREMVSIPCLPNPHQPAVLGHP